MADVEQIVRVFEKRIRDSTTLSALARKASRYPDAQDYAKKTAEILMKTLERFVDISSLTQDEAVAIFSALLESNHKEVSSICRRVQERINERAGIRIGVLEPEFDLNRARGIGTAITDAEDASPEYVKNLVTNNSLAVVDDSIQVNTQSQSNMGLKVHITRRYDDVGLHDGKDACQWCLDREGEWDNYKDALDAGVFQRHPGCGCVITYEVGKTRTWQNKAGTWNQM